MPAKARTPTAAKKAARPTAPSEEAIRSRAYEIYLARGAGPGSEQADWDQAARELGTRKVAAR